MENNGNKGNHKIQRNIKNTLDKREIKAVIVATDPFFTVAVAVALVITGVVYIL